MGQAILQFGIQFTGVEKKIYLLMSPVFCSILV